MREEYYRGFEGEPAILFKSSINGTTDAIKIWVGYFDELMSLFKLGPAGKWERLAYFYHLHSGWYVNDNWKVPEIQLVIDDFKKLLVPDGRIEIKQIRDDIVTFLERSREGNSDVFLEYD